MDIKKRFQSVRERTERITNPLTVEDYVVQPIVDVSPPKWHLAHTTWFFETFVLEALPGYKIFHPNFGFLFNSYYESLGERTIRTDRGNITRPTVNEVLAYRKHVNEAMTGMLEREVNRDLHEVIELGLQHEQQHQELLITDIKYILGHNPIFPIYDERPTEITEQSSGEKREWIGVEGGIHAIGFEGEGFCFDNELGRHKVYMEDFEISSELVTKGEYLEFVNDGGYANFKFWHAEAWDWVKTNGIQSPMYWHNIEGVWHEFTLTGLKKLDLDDHLKHVSYYEAAAFAEWANKRLPTEFEWEVAADKLNHGTRWEWTNSAYLPYPGFKKAEGAIGEYNGKFMVNQMVLRGGSCASAPDHVRKTYRNFFHPHLQWQYSGIRLAKK